MPQNKYHPRSDTWLFPIHFSLNQSPCFIRQPTAAGMSMVMVPQQPDARGDAK